MKKRLKNLLLSFFAKDIYDFNDNGEPKKIVCYKIKGEYIAVRLKKNKELSTETQGAIIKALNNHIKQKNEPKYTICLN